MNEFFIADLVFNVFIFLYSLSLAIQVICILKLLEEERKERNETRNFIIE